LFHWKPRTLLLRLALPALLLGGGGVGVTLLAPASASALPQFGTTCSGWLTPDSGGPAIGEPDSTDYAFFCSTGITAYSIAVDRIRTDGDNVDDYNPNPLVYSAGTNDGVLSPTESVTCGGATPSNGIDCYSLVGTTAGSIGAGDEIDGSFDLTDQYCSYLPKGAKPGTLAVPRAIVELTVTDSTGAEDGPFELHPVKACKKVAAVVPKVTTKAATKKAVKVTSTKATKKTTKPAVRKTTTVK
jgi:hypothetical protein